MPRDDPRPKVLVIGPTPPPYNGMSVATRNVLRSSLNEQFALIHLDTTDRRGLANIGRLDPVNIYLALRHFLQFLWLLAVERPRIVYLPIAQNRPGFLRDCLFLLPGRWARRKVMVHLHGSYFHEFYRKSWPLMRALIRWALKDICRAIVLDEQLKGAFRDLVPGERLVAVPNGLDTEIFDLSRSQRKGLASKGRAYRVLYLGTLVRSKGFLDLLHAVPLVVAQRPGAKFTFAGELCYEGERREALGFISQNNLEPVVELVGVVSGAEKAELLCSADLFVFPSQGPEGQPFVILEAMAAGLPIVTTDQGCIKETVGEGGLIVEGRNPRALAQAILKLLDDDALREKMGRANRDKVLSEYTLETSVRNLGKVFDEALAGDQPRGQRSEDLSKSAR